MFDGQFFPSGTQPVQFEGGRPYNRWLRKDIKEVIDGLGLSTGLKLALDAGDSTSYTSGQSWADLSGNGYDFFRGAGSGAAADDPTFNGAAGGLSSSEYWSFDGGDIFTYDAANETWMQNLHKNNAIFSFLLWVYVPDVTPAANVGFFGTAGNIGDLASTGVGFCLHTSNLLDWRVQNGSGATNAALKFASLPLSANTWTMVGISVNEATGSGGLKFFKDGTSSSDDATYTSPSAGGASRTLGLAQVGNGSSKPESGSRIAMVAAWEGTALTVAQAQAFHTATRGRFGV